MKKLTFAIFVAALIGMTSVASATDVASTSKTSSVSQNDAVAVQKGVQELGKLFNIETPKQPEPAASAPSNAEKTVAQVMDKAIDKVSDVVGAMAQAINNIAPEVWRIMLKQQYAKAIMACVVPVGVILILLAYMGLVGKYWKPEKKTSAYEMTEWEARMACVRVIPIALTCVAALWFFNRLADSIALLINPEFYAIQDLLRMILNKGM